MPQIGVALPLAAADTRATTALAFAQRAEAAGVGSVWVLDRLVYDCYEPLITLAAVATGTQRVRLGMGILLGALRPPVLLAKMLATLDQLSAGRVIVGLGAGTRADDFEAVGVPHAGRGRRLDELIDVLTLAWSGAPVRYAGRAYTLDVGPVGPRPLQQPHPPLWLGGRAEAVLRRTARVGDGYIGRSSDGPAGFRRIWEQIRAYAEAAGRDPATIVPAAQVYACVDDDPRRAAALTAEYLTSYYGAAPADLSGYLLGSPEQCVALAKQYFAAGVEVLIVGSVTANGNYFERLCTEVIPRLQGR
jgi:probable F420-dependent oxidoreductase